jgi:ABC-type glycerol-3-phosphate transport system permease component
LLFGVALFILPIWVMVAGATQDAGAIARGGLSLIPNPAGLGIFWQALFYGGASRAGYPVWHMMLVSFAMAAGIAVGKSQFHWSRLMPSCFSGFRFGISRSGRFF